MIAFLSDLFPNVSICQIKKLNKTTKLYETEINCYYTLHEQVKAIFITNFIKNIPALLLPMTIQRIKKQLSYKSMKIVEATFSDIDFAIEGQSFLNPF